MKRTVIIIAGVVLVCCAGAFALDRMALSQTYARVAEPKASLLPTYALYENDYPRTDVEFQLNGATLRGHVYGADNDRGLIVFRHGIFSQHQDYLALITALVDKGWRVFAYDAIGCGESDGDSTMGMSQSPLDVAAAIDYARESGMADGMPLALFGHSWGGYGVAAALGLRPGSVDACVTMSGYDTPVKILTASAERAYGVAGRVQQPFLWLNCLIDFGAENADRSASDAVVNSGVPTLVIHGTGDAVVPYEEMSILDSLHDRGVGEMASDGVEGGEAGRDVASGAGGEDGAHDIGNVRGISGTSATGSASGRPLSQNAGTAVNSVKLLVKSDEGRNGHNDYFYSRESQAYLNECAAALQQLLDENGDNADAPAVQEFLESVDLRRANTADPQLINEIDSFLQSTL